MTITHAWERISKIVEIKNKRVGLTVDEVKAFMFMDRLVENYKKFLLIK